ncbi:MAG: cytochrome C oxidase subunit IV family protein [Pirellulales bacterium]
MTAHDSPAVEGVHRPGHTKQYVMIYAALMALLLVTIGVAYLPLGMFNLPVALAIAFVKALLVVLYFMHLADSPRLTWLTVSGTLVWLAIMIIGIVADYWSRKFPGEM